MQRPRSKRHRMRPCRAGAPPRSGARSVFPWQGVGVDPGLACASAPPPRAWPLRHHGPGRQRRPQRAHGTGGGVFGRLRGLFQPDDAASVLGVVVATRFVVLTQRHAVNSGVRMRPAPDVNVQRPGHRPGTRAERQRGQRLHQHPQHPAPPWRACVAEGWTAQGVRVHGQGLRGRGGAGCTACKVDALCILGLLKCGPATTALRQAKPVGLGVLSTQCRPYLLRTESRNAVARMAAQTQLKESTPSGANPIASVKALHLTRSTSSVETGAAELPQDCRMNVATAAISSLFSNCPYGGMPKG